MNDNVLVDELIKVDRAANDRPILKFKNQDRDLFVSEEVAKRAKSYVGGEVKVTFTRSKIGDIYIRNGEEFKVGYERDSNGEWVKRENTQGNDGDLTKTKFVVSVDPIPVGYQRKVAEFNSLSVEDQATAKMMAQAGFVL